MRDAHVEFSVSVRLTAPVQAAIRGLHVGGGDVWAPALRQDGSVRERAHVIEAKELVGLDDYPSSSRLIVRREPLHPGAQQTFDESTGTGSRRS